METSPPPPASVRRAGRPSPKRRGGGFAYNLKRLPRSFYLRPTVVVAKDLLGKYFVRKLGRQILVGRIVEVEAYCEDDPASHSYRGMTERSSVMFEEGGHLYVYFTYGMHFCANVVTREKGIGEAVLIRAVEPVEGIEIMRRNRGVKGKHSQLTNGPAKVCEAFRIKRNHNDTDLCANEIWIAKEISPPYAIRNPKFPVVSSPRIGIQNGRDKKWRFYIVDNPFVSKRQPPAG